MVRAGPDQPGAHRRRVREPLLDYEGNRYLDFSSQLVNVNIGYQHPRLVAAIQEAAARQCTIAPSFADESRSEAARLITGLAPEGLDRVFFTNGGAEATENAMRMARLHTGRHKVLTAYRSYHGATNGSITATGDPRRWPSEPGMPGIVHFWGPYLYRSAFHATTEAEECERALQHLRETIMVEGASTIAAIMLETVVGTNGILVPPDGYLAGVREICDEHGIVWIADEVMAGFGRCGEWFAVDHWGVSPDLICFAKGVNSGYLPLGGVVISDPIAETFAERAYPGGLTYSGHPLACASAVASIRIFEEEGILENVRKVSDTVIAPRLAEIALTRAGLEGSALRVVSSYRPGFEDAKTPHKQTLRFLFDMNEAWTEIEIYATPEVKAAGFRHIQQDRRLGT